MLLLQGFILDVEDLKVCIFKQILKLVCSTIRVDNWLLLSWVNLETPDVVEMCFSSLYINHLSESPFSFDWRVTCISFSVFS